VPQPLQEAADSFHETEPALSSRVRAVHGELASTQDERHGGATAFVDLSTQLREELLHFLPVEARVQAPDLLDSPGIWRHGITIWYHCPKFKAGAHRSAF